MGSDHADSIMAKSPRHQQHGRLVKPFTSSFPLDSVHGLSAVPAFRYAFAVVVFPCEGESADTIEQAAERGVPFVLCGYAFHQM